MQLDFDIAVYAVNEAATIEACITSIDRACAVRHGHIKVLLNGTTDHTVSILDKMRLTHAKLTVYSFPIADKANAINSFLYDLRQADSSAYFGVDAYTKIGFGSLDALMDALAAQPEALIASGVSINGRSARLQAERTIAGGAVNGQLYAMRPSFVNRIVAARLRLPLELYWGDGLLGSMAAHDLDAVKNPWENRRVIGVSNAPFEITPLSIFRWGDIQRQYKREIRQARGRIQTEAIKSLIYQGGYRALPPNANDMMLEWLKTNRVRFQSLRNNFFTYVALRQVYATERVRPTAPHLIFSR
jgi:hypothetical protein